MDDIAEPEREQVIRWLKTVVGWTLHKTIPGPKGRTAYVFHESDSGGCYTVHTFKQDQLRWRYMREVGFSEIASLRVEADRLWNDYVYVAERLVEAAQRQAIVSEGTAS